ncbi:MAG: PQQ-binding-like beta-propeller repeat protein [Longimicrobiales bacterium]
MGSAARSPYASETVTPDLDLAWRKEIGRGVTAPVQLHGDVLIAATTNRTVVVLNATTGMQYWSRSFRSPIAGAPLKSGDRLFLGTGDRDRKVHAIQIERGREAWSREVGTVRIEPALADGRIVVATEEGNVIALAEDDGEVLWTTLISSPPATPPVSWGTDVVIASARDTLYRVDAATGEILAQRALPATVSAPPLLDGDHLLLPLQSGVIRAVQLPGLDSVWSTDLGVPVLASPVRAGDAVFALARDATVWRIEAGGDARRIASLDGSATGALTAIRAGLLVGLLDGVLVLLDLDGEFVWRHDFHDSIVAPVAVRHARLYVALLRGDLVVMQ